MAALGLTAGAVVLAAVLAVERFPRGIAVLACLLVALASGWSAMRHEGLARFVAATVSSAAITAAVLVLILLGRVVLDLLVVAAFVLAIACARAAFRFHVDLPRAARPILPVLFFNPLSGGGTARRLHLAEEARRRGIEPIELGPGQDLRELVEQAVSAGADALAMAGGDGSQAIVAEVAARRGLPYACVPAGTRNHFALDLGVDRDDVIGSLDALVDGGARRVDLAEVNGRVFVNNVSIGLYANAVQRPAYREAKIRTLIEAAPGEVGPEASGTRLRWRGPDGEEERDAIALLVSNNPYRLGASLGSGTRPRLDAGLLGVTSASVGRAAHGAVTMRSWCCSSFTVDADGSVAAGIDGESSTLTPPLNFVSRPGALAVRIAAGHPGHSPSTVVPRSLGATMVELIRIAVGNERAVEKSQNTREETSDGHFRGRAPGDPHPR